MSIDEGKGKQHLKGGKDRDMDHRHHYRRSGQNIRTEKPSPGRKGGGERGGEGGGEGEQDKTGAMPTSAASTTAAPTQSVGGRDDNISNDNGNNDNNSNNTDEVKQQGQQQQPPEGFDITNLGLFLFPNLPRGRLPRFPWFGGNCPIASGGRGGGNSPGCRKPTDDFNSPPMRTGVVVLRDQEEARPSSGDDGREGENDDDGVVRQRRGEEEEEEEDDDDDNGEKEYEDDGMSSSSSSSAMVETRSVTRGRVQGCWPRGSLFHKARSRGGKEVGVSDGDDGGVVVGQGRSDKEKSGVLPLSLSSSSGAELGRAPTEDDKRLAGRVQGYWIGAAASR